MNEDAAESPFSAEQRTRSALTLVAAVVLTAITLPLVGASGLIGGVIAGHYLGGGYDTNAALGGAVGLGGTALVVMPLFVSTAGGIGVFPELYYILVNGVLGAVGSVLATLYNDWRDGGLSAFEAAR